MTRVDSIRWFIVPLLATFALAPAAGHAQSPEAEVLFREGRKLIKSGRLEAGCDKLDASEKLESSVGTLLNLGDCREKLGRIASAWAAFRKAEATAKLRGRDEKRRNEAARRAQALEPRLSHLVIVVTSKPDGLVIKRDDEVVESPLWNTPLPLDPDTYTIVAEAPGYKPWRTQVEIGDKQRRQLVTVPALEKAPVAAAPREQPATPREKLAPTDLPPIVSEPPPPIFASEKPRPPSMWTTSRKVAIGIGVVGLAAAGTGVYFGLRSRDLQDQSDELCPGSICDVPEGLRLNDRAQTAARNANIFYAAGGVALAASAIVWFVGGPDRELRVSPTVGSGQAGVSFGGQF